MNKAYDLMTGEYDQLVLRKIECEECGEETWSYDDRDYCDVCKNYLTEVYYREKGMYDEGEYDNYPWEEYNP